MTRSGRGPGGRGASTRPTAERTSATTRMPSDPSGAGRQLLAAAAFASYERIWFATTCTRLPSEMLTS